MDLYWHVMLFFLYAELALAAALSLPGIPTFLRKTVANWTTDQLVRTIGKIYLIVIGILFAGCIVELMTMKPPTAPGDTHEEFHHYEENKLKNHRGALISGFCMFLSLVIEQLSILTRTNIRLQTDCEVLQKQAKGVSSEYMKLMKEGESPKATTKAVSAKDLESETKDLNEKLEKARTELVAIKKQAENQQKAFTQLQEENKTLKNQLEDFNLVLGDKKKKKHI